MNKLVLVTIVTLGIGSNSWAEGGNAEYEKAALALRKQQVETLAAYSAQAGRGGEDAAYWSRMFRAVDFPADFSPELTRELNHVDYYFDVRGGKNRFFTIHDKVNFAKAVAAHEVSRDYEWIKNNPEAFEKRVKYLIDLRAKAEFADYESPAWKDMVSLKAYTRQRVWANLDAEKIINRKELLKQIEQLRLNVGESKDLIDLSHLKEQLGIAERNLNMTLKKMNSIRFIPEMPKIKSAVNIARRGIPSIIVGGGLALGATLMNGSSAHAEPANTVGGSAPSQLNKHDDDAFGEGTR